MSASGSSSEGERRPLIDETTKARSEGYTISAAVVADEEAPVVPGEGVDTAAEETVKTRSTYAIVRNIFLVLAIVGGLALFVKAFIDADDVEVRWRLILCKPLV